MVITVGNFPSSTIMKLAQTLKRSQDHLPQDSLMYLFIFIFYMSVFGPEVGVR